MSGITCQVSGGTCHVSCVMCQVYLIYYFFLQRGEAIPCRVRYQRGLPCLVFLLPTETLEFCSSHIAATNQESNGNVPFDPVTSNTKDDHSHTNID